MKNYAVIVPIHNGEEFILETLKSIDLQTHQPKEIIIVDDELSSESEKILERLKRQLATGTMPVITCPNKICGCGLCVPKAKHHNITEAMFKKSVKGLTPVIGAKMIS